ncbi:MAG: putative quinol monooxygenase [Pyrinomonadaceae bacterium]
MDRTGRDNTIVILTRVTVSPENRKELCQTISSLIDPLKREKGCLGYCFYEESDDENTFALIGEWETADAWIKHLNSENFAVLLGSIGLLCARQQVDHNLLSHVAYAEAMTKARIGSQHAISVS